MPTTPVPITALPAAPDRADRSTFSARAVAMFTALKDVFVGEVNAIAITANTNATEAAASALAAAGSETIASAAATSAAASAGAAAWVSGTTYALGDVRWSPANRLLYRRIVAGAGTTDPIADAVNWALHGAGYLGVPQNTQSAAYTLALADAGKHIYHPSADTTARTWTIPANASVAFPLGTAITLVNDTSAGVLTIAITTDTLVFAGAGSTGSRTLAANGMATLLKVGATRWLISGVGLT